MLSNRKRFGVRAAIGALIALGATIGLGIAPASAAEYDYPGAIDPASITVTTVDGTGGVNVGEQIRIDAAWSVPDGAAAGQTFGFTLPEEFAGFNGTFSIPSKDDPSQTVANCTVSSDAAPVVTCTLTDYVTGRTGIEGTLWFVAKTDKATTDTTVDFVVDGKITPVDIPGGGIIPGKPLPGTPAKWSSLTDDGKIAWVVAIPGSAFADAGKITVDDELTPAGAGTAEHHNVDGVLTVWGTDETNTKPFTVPGWTGEWNATGTAFHLEIPGPIDATKYYMVKYTTEPTNPVEGATYANTATVNGITVHDNQVWTTAGGGAGTGKETGAFTLVKAVAGDGAGKVPADAAYTVTYSYGDPVVTKTITLVPGTPVQSIALPLGTVVTLEEAAPPVVDGVVWNTPVFGGTGVRVLDGGKAQLTIGEGAAASITLTNTATATPPVTPPTPATPEKPAPPKELPLTGSLASTGSDVPTPLLLAGAAALLLGLAMTTGATLRRRRR